LELSSAKEIIKLLQEEINLQSGATSVPTDKGNINRDPKLSHVTNKPTTWTEVPSNKGKTRNRSFVQ
jgi:hypothetical protein